MSKALRSVRAAVIGTSAIIAAAVVFIASAAQAASVELLTNGNFETGTFAGWSEFDQAGGSGSFFVDTPGGPTPSSGFPTATNPLGGGSFYAVTDTNDPGTHVLVQSFTVPAAALSLTMAFDVFFNNQAYTDTKGVQGLDYTGASNQHAEVDLLTASAAPFDTGAGLIVTAVDSTTITSTPQPYAHYTADLTPGFGSGPGTYQVRFAEVDNNGYFNFGVDNVSILYSPLPEPAAAGLLLIAGAMQLTRRRRAIRDRA